MRVSTIAEIKSMEAEAVVGCFKGKLTALYKPKTGESQRGPWSFQNGEVTDGQGKIKIVLKNRPELAQTWKNRTICFMSNEDGGNGLIGITTNDNDFKGRITREVMIGPEAEITEVAAQGPPASSGAHASPPASRASSNPAADCKIYMARRASGMKIAIKAAYGIRDEVEAITKETMSQERIQGMIGSLFISADRAGQFDQLPVDLDYGTLKAREKNATPPPPPPPPPEPEAEPVEEDDVPF